MTQQRHSMDGFVPRRPGGQAARPNKEAANRFQTPAPFSSSEVPRRQLGGKEVTRSELDETLRGIDTSEEVGKKDKRRKKARF